MSDDLEFTGERFTPECVREIWYEHYHRYAFACPAASGRRVLDAACGEGYGSSLLARTAQSVHGVDIDTKAVAHARARYADQANLRFDSMDATVLDDLPDASFDLITSFETLEHVLAQERMLAGFGRVLAPGGVLLVSSPDKAQYSDASGHANPFHVRELYRSEFEALLATRFPTVRLFAQKLLFQGALWRIDGGGARFATSSLDAGDAQPQPGLGFAPLYYVAACAADEESLNALDLPDLHLFGDRAESVYSHYNREVARVIEAGHALIERDARIAELEAACARLERAGPATPATHPRQSWWQRLRAR